MAKNAKAKNVLKKDQYCTKEIPKAKTDYNFTLTNKLIDPKAVSLS